MNAQIGSRRAVLKLGLFGGALLAVGGFASWFVGRDADDDRHDVLGGLIPALLDGALPRTGPARNAAIAATLDAVETAIGGLAPVAQAELARLFSLVSAAPTRLLLTGLTGPWRDASIGEVTRVLQDWRLHRLSLLQSAYHGLHDLVIGTWYADETHWEAIGYPGPPRL